MQVNNKSIHERISAGEWEANYENTKLGETKEERIARRHRNSAAERAAADAFFIAVMDDIGVTNPKIAALIRQKAWEDGHNGHSSGLHEVYNYAIELSEFVDKVIAATKE